MRLHLEVANVRGPFHNVCDVRANIRFPFAVAFTLRRHRDRMANTVHRLPIVDFSSRTPCSNRVEEGGKLLRILWRPPAQDCHFFNLILVMILIELSEFIHLIIIIFIEDWGIWPRAVLQNEKKIETNVLAVYETMIRQRD